MTATAALVSVVLVAAVLIVCLRAGRAPLSDDHDHPTHNEARPGTDPGRADGHDPVGGSMSTTHDSHTASTFTDGATFGGPVDELPEGSPPARFARALDPIGDSDVACATIRASDDDAVASVRVRPLDHPAVEIVDPPDEDRFGLVTVASCCPEAAFEGLILTLEKIASDGVSA